MNKTETVSSSIGSSSSSAVNLTIMPDETYDPLIFLDAKTASKMLEGKVSENLIQELKLNGGGGATESTTTSNDSTRQKIFMKTDCVNEANGSSFIELGNSKVLCSLYGPTEVPRKDDYDFKIANLNVEFRFASFSCFMQRRGTLNQRDQTLDEKDLSSIIEKSLKPSILLHKYPKSQIDLYILCIQNDYDSKNILAASTIAASLALTNASIELYDMVASFTSLQTNLTLSYMPSLHQITSVYFTNDKEETKLYQQRSSISTDLFKSQVKECIENCKRVYSLMQACCVKSLPTTANQPDAP